MNCKDVIFLGLMFMAVPAWIGTIWVRLLRLEGCIVRMLHAWVLGFATMLAVSQLVLVPLVALGGRLTTALSIWEFILQILVVIAFYLWMREGFWKAGRFPASKERARSHKKGAHHGWEIAFVLIALVLILMQAYIPARYEHSDDDDSRFIAEQVSAVVHDTMYVESPIDASFMYWDTGEVRKDLTSPWAMFLAMNAKLAGIEPAVLSHTYLPFVLTLLCYAVYALIGMALFKSDWEKTGLFLIFLSVIHLAGYTSTHTLASMLLLRIWQGKAMCAGFLIPLMFYLFYQIMQKKYKRGWLPLLYVAGIGACLLSGIGIVTAPILLFLYGVLDFCYYRAWRKTFAIWMAAVPCAIFFGYYLM